MQYLHVSDVGGNIVKHLHFFAFSFWQQADPWATRVNAESHYVAFVKLVSVQSLQGLERNSHFENGQVIFPFNPLGSIVTFWNFTFNWIWLLCISYFITQWQQTLKTMFTTYPLNFSPHSIFSIRFLSFSPLETIVHFHSTAFDKHRCLNKNSLFSLSYMKMNLFKL